MELIKFKILKCWATEPVNNKVKEAQVNLHLCLLPILKFNVNLAESEYSSNVFNFNIDIFSLFKLDINKDKEVDHAGFSFEINILGLEFMYRKYDVRHWDDNNECWYE